MSLTDTLGRLIQFPLTNHSGGAVAFKDVVVIDASQAASFTTTTVSGYTGELPGVVIEPGGIANGAVGMVAFAGPVPGINLASSAGIGNFIKCHSVAKQGTPHATPSVQGDFAIALGTGTSPAAILMSPNFASAVASPELLGIAFYNPSGGVVDHTNTNALAAVDTTHLRVTFTAPASGNVVVKVSGGRLSPGNSNTHIGALEGSTDLGTAVQNAASVALLTTWASLYVTGLSAGSHTFDLSVVDTNQTSAGHLRYGYSTSNSADATSPAFIEVWSAP